MARRPTQSVTQARAAISDHSVIRIIRTQEAGKTVTVTRIEKNIEEKKTKELSVDPRPRWLVGPEAALTLKGLPIYGGRIDYRVGGPFLVGAQVMGGPGGLLVGVGIGFEF